MVFQLFYLPFSRVSFFLSCFFVCMVFQLFYLPFSRVSFFLLLLCPFLLCFTPRCFFLCFCFVSLDSCLFFSSQLSNFFCFDSSFFLNFCFQLLCLPVSLVSC